MVIKLSPVVHLCSTQSVFNSNSLSLVGEEISDPVADASINSFSSLSLCRRICGVKFKARFAATQKYILCTEFILL